MVIVVVPSGVCQLKGGSLSNEISYTITLYYLGVPFDLSSVLFIVTCNDSSQIARPLLDRMEFIELSGYTVEEKLEIAKRHLIKKAVD